MERARGCGRGKPGQPPAAGSEYRQVPRLYAGPISRIIADQRAFHLAGAAIATGRAGAAVGAVLFHRHDSVGRNYESSRRISSITCWPIPAGNFTLRWFRSLRASIWVDLTSARFRFSAINREPLLMARKPRPTDVPPPGVWGRDESTRLRACWAARATPRRASMARKPRRTDVRPPWRLRAKTNLRRFGFLVRVAQHIARGPTRFRCSFHRHKPATACLRSLQMNTSMILSSGSSMPP